MAADGGLAFYLSPLGAAALYLWVFLSLSAVQLTVRLIRRYDLRETALAALALAAAAWVAAIAYLWWVDRVVDPAALARLAAIADEQRARAARQGYLLLQHLLWLPAPAAVLAAINYLVARRALRMRQRAAVFTALAMGVLTAPWAGILFL